MAFWGKQAGDKQLMLWKEGVYDSFLERAIVDRISAFNNLSTVMIYGHYQINTIVAILLHLHFRVVTFPPAVYLNISLWRSRPMANELWVCQYHDVSRSYIPNTPCRLNPTHHCRFRFQFQYPIPQPDVQISFDDLEKFPPYARIQ